MVPPFFIVFLATVVVVLVVIWSISRSVQYSELFTLNPRPGFLFQQQQEKDEAGVRYQMGLCAVNVMVVLLAVITVCYLHHSRRM